MHVCECLCMHVTFCTLVWEYFFKTCCGSCKKSNKNSKLWMYERGFVPVPVSESKSSVVGILWIWFQSKIPQQQIHCHMDCIAFSKWRTIKCDFFLRMKKNKHNFFSNYYYYLPAAETPGTTKRDGIRKHNVKYFIQNISDLAKVWFLTSSHIVVIQFCGWCLGVEWKKSKTRSRCTVVPIQWNEYMNPTTTVSKLD